MEPKNILPAALFLLAALFACTARGDSADENFKDKGPVIKVSGRVAEPDGTGIAGVPVTDGFDMTTTDADGRYTLGFHSGASRFVHISVPSGYELPLHAQGHPLFFRKLSPRGKGDADFTLVRRSAPAESHTVLVFGDIQLRDRNTDIMIPNLRDKIVPDVLSWLASHGGPCVGISVGDLVWNEMSLFSEYRRQMGRLGIPVCNVIGNHDHDPDVRGDEFSDESYEDNFGPANYSFNIGKIHYVMLDDVIYTQGQDFRKGLTDDVLAWLRKDLAYVPKGGVLVIGMHIPLDTNELPDTGHKFRNYNEMMTLLKEYRVYVLAGHRHSADVYNFPAPYQMFTHILCPRTGGDPKINGDYCNDGTPSGYLVLEIDGEDIRWRHKTAGSNDRDIQMTALTPEDTGNDYVFANIWYWDTEWGWPEWWENGEKIGEMQHHPRVDTNYNREYMAANNGKPFTEKSWHMFRYRPSAGVKSGMVKVTDRFGNTYTKNVSW